MTANGWILWVTLGVIWPFAGGLLWETWREFGKVLRESGEVNRDRTPVR